MFTNASQVDASHSTFSEVHRDQYFYSRTHVQGNQTVNTIVHGNQVVQGTFGLENLYRASVAGAAFDSFDRHPAPACLPGTRLKVLARIAEWIDDSNCEQRMCWLSGLAGSGKSAIAQSTAESYARQGRLAASFFFSRKEIMRRKAQGFFPTLACQMLAFIPSIRPALLHALEADATTPTKVLSEQARRLLQEPILSSTDSFPHSILIVVDSLDECDDMKMATEIVHLFSEILLKCRWPLKVLFTSRAEPHIVQTFQHSELCNITCSLRLQEFDVDDDIRAYLRHSFKGMQESMINMPVNGHPSPWPPDDELELIARKAAGLFIFATTVVKYVGIDYSSPVARLRIVLRAFDDSAVAESFRVHSSLDMLYLDALRVIPDVEKVRFVLGSVVFASRPLSISGLNDLLWEAQLDASYIVKNLCSVLMISDSDTEVDGSIRIYHTSFRDFLTNSHRSGPYFVEPIVFHRILARACLEVMNRHLTADMCNLGDSSLLNREVGDLDERCKLHIKGGVRYACRWFTHHLSYVPWDHKMDSTLIPSLQDFANRHLLHWIEVLSLTGELESAVSNLREIADWLKRSPIPYKETLVLFRDAERLVLMCYDPIHQAALQIYYSIPCVPARAPIRATCSYLLKNKFVVTRGLDDHWKYSLRSVFTGAVIKSLAISASGRLIASAGEAPGVQLWDALTGNNTGHFRGKGISTCSVVFSPSGDCVAIGYDTGTIDVWDVSTGQQLFDSSRSSHGTSVTVLAFSHNGLFIASGAADGSVHVWGLSTGLKRSFTYHKGSISCLLFSFDDGLIASCSEDASIITFSAHSSQLVRRFEGHTSKVNTISFSPDSARIASGSDDQTVRLWDTRTGVCLRTFAGAHGKSISKVWITGDSKNIVSVCNMDVYMWDIGSPNRKSPQHIWSVNHYFKKLMAMFPAWYAKIVHLFPARFVGRLSEVDDGTFLYAVPSPDGRAMVLSHSSSVLFLELSAPKKGLGKVLGKPSAVNEPPLFWDDSDDSFTAVAMSPDTTALVTSMDNGVIKIWSTSPRSDWKTFENALKRSVDGFWPAPDGHSLLVKPMAGLQLVTTAGVITKDLETGGDVLGKFGAVPSPDSRYFAYWAEYAWNVDKSFSIHIYNASSGKRLKRIPGFFNITCSRFSAESELFACAHGDGVVQVWELPSVFCKTTIMTGHTAITSLEFLPGNNSLIVGSDQGCVEIRLVENGDITYHVQCSPTPSEVSALAVSHEALIVIVGHEDGSTFVWDPSYPDVSPHRLSPKISVNNKADDPDGVDFIKFTGSRSICTRSVKGIICTWDLTRCLSGYAEREKAVPEENGGADVPIADVSTGPSNSSDPSADRSTSLTTEDTFGTQNTIVVPTVNTFPSADPTSLERQNRTSEPEPTPPQTTVDPEPTKCSRRVSGFSCPHLVSRSESNIVYDRCLRSTYAVDTQEGWVYQGSRRMFWLPSDFRPASPTALSAFGDRFAILTGSRLIVLLDLSPMVSQSSANVVGEWLK